MYLYIYIYSRIECRVSILGITILIWEVSPITVPRTLWGTDSDVSRTDTVRSLGRRLSYLYHV